MGEANRIQNDNGIESDCSLRKHFHEITKYLNMASKTFQETTKNSNEFFLKGTIKRIFDDFCFNCFWWKRSQALIDCLFLEKKLWTREPKLEVVDKKWNSRPIWKKKDIGWNLKIENTSKATMKAVRKQLWYHRNKSMRDGKFFFRSLECCFYIPMKEDNGQHTKAKKSFHYFCWPLRKLSTGLIIEDERRSFNEKLNQATDSYCAVSRLLEIKTTIGFKFPALDCYQYE